MESKRCGYALPRKPSHIYRDLPGEIGRSRETSLAAIDLVSGTPTFSPTLGYHLKFMFTFTPLCEKRVNQRAGFRDIGGQLTNQRKSAAAKCSIYPRFGILGNCLLKKVKNNNTKNCKGCQILNLSLSWHNSKYI